MQPARLLRGERLRLAALIEADIPTMLRWDDDTVYKRLLDSRPAFPNRQADLTKWLEEADRQHGPFFFAIRRLEDDLLLGFIELEGIQWPHGIAWMGYSIGAAEHRGQGYGYEAVTLALHFAFHELNLHRISIAIFSYNVASLALAKKLGFVQEGTVREALLRDGRRYDMFILGLLRHEWEARNGFGDSA